MILSENKEIKENKVVVGGIIKIDASNIGVIPSGTLLKVLESSQEDLVNEYILKTNLNEYPFISIKNGNYWGRLYSSYKFMIVALPTTTINYIVKS